MFHGTWVHIVQLILLYFVHQAFLFELLETLIIFTIVETRSESRGAAVLVALSARLLVNKQRDGRKWGSQMLLSLP